MYKSANFIGRLCKDPKEKFTPSGMAISEFSIAINEKLKDKSEKVHYFDFAAFGKTAEYINQYLYKGNMVFVEASPIQERWEKNDQKFSKVNFIVTRLQNLTEKKDSSSSSQEKSSSSYQDFESKKSDNEQMMMDIPF